MKIFISWSGTLSKKVAELLNDWIPNVLQYAEPWFSPEDIAKGEVWFNTIADSLANTGQGIICLTKENLNAPWILFEAGALSKGLPKNRVCTLLVDLEPKDLKPPLAQFNATKTVKHEIAKLLKDINDSAPTDKKLPPDRITKAFDMWWPDFEKKLGNAHMEVPVSEIDVSRSLDDIVGEILETVRAIHSTVQSETVIDPSNPFASTIHLSKPPASAVLESRINQLAESEFIRYWGSIENATGDFCMVFSEEPSEESKALMRVAATGYGKTKVRYLVSKTGLRDAVIQSSVAL